MNKKKVERATLYTLLFSYILIAIPIFLFHYNLVDLSFEWLFLPFVLTGLLFYFFKIDSRYLGKQFDFYYEDKTAFSNVKDAWQFFSKMIESGKYQFTINIKIKDPTRSP